MKEPNSYLMKNNPIKISTQPRGCGTQWDFQTKGSFQDRTCSIVDSKGNIIAEVNHIPSFSEHILRMYVRKESSVKTSPLDKKSFQTSVFPTVSSTWEKKSMMPLTKDSKFSEKRLQ